MMTSSEKQRAPLRWVSLFLFLMTLPVLSSCTALVGGAAVVTVLGIGALTTRCYDYLDVSVYDDLGKKTCDATVVATKDGSSVELNSCYYAPLTDGTWSLRATLPGRVDAVTTVIVDHAQDCTRHVQSVELTMKRPGAVRVQSPIRPAPAPAPVPPAALPPQSAPSNPEPGPGTDPGQNSASGPAANANVPPVGTFAPVPSSLPSAAPAASSSPPQGR